MNNSWTKEDLETLKQLWTEGVQASVIGIRLGRTRNAVLGKIHRCGFKCEVKKAANPEVVRRRAARAAGAQPLRWGKPVSLVPTAPVPPKQIICDDARDIPLLELREHHCRWITTDDSPWLFCGRRKVANSSYCGPHSAAAFAGFVKAPWSRGVRNGTR